jgi:hypothetical protein
VGDDGRGFLMCIQMLLPGVGSIACMDRMILWFFRVTRMLQVMDQRQDRD